MFVRRRDGLDQPGVRRGVSLRVLPSLHRVDGSRLDTSYVEKASCHAAGRVMPLTFPWLACTKDALACGCVPLTDEVRFGFAVVRNAAVDQNDGRISLQVWPDHKAKAESAMTGLKDRPGRKIETKVIERGVPLALSVVQLDDDAVADSGHAAVLSAARAVQAT